MNKLSRWVAGVLIAISVIMLVTGVPNRDPQDYYGTYYSQSSNGQIQEYVIEKDVCYINYYIYYSPSAKPSKSVKYNYHEYTNSSKLKYVCDVDSKYEGCNAIVLYEYANKANGVILWIVDSTDGNYTFEIQMDNNETLIIEKQ